MVGRVPVHLIWGERLDLDSGLADRSGNVLRIGSCVRAAVRSSRTSRWSSPYYPRHCLSRAASREAEGGALGSLLKPTSTLPS